MDIIKELWNDGSLWALIGFLAYIYKIDIRPLLKSHLRNSHEKSLLACADRAVASVAKVADASPSDREQEMLSLIFTFADKHKIPINRDVAKQFLNLALSRFKQNGGKFKQSLQVKVNQDGSVQEEDDNK